MKISLIDAATERLSELRQALKDLPAIQFIEVQKAFYMCPPRGLDMIFMTLPAAERWGPDFKSREAQILTTSSEDQDKGFPPFIVTGVNLTAEDPKDPLSQVKIVLEAALAAVKIHNDKNTRKINDLGFWAMDLTRGVTTNQLSALLHRTLHCL